MIGLGSNRLTVCRRGGMSVTQAGRGGMEWLAGGRIPSWASPYSAAATAALKAQFPTQWPTIRDYGWQHEALVPFINEDPMLVMSLIAGLGIRLILTTAFNVAIDTEYYWKAGSSIKMDFVSITNTDNYSIFGASNGSAYNQGEVAVFWNRGKWDVVVPTSNSASGATQVGTYAANTAYSIEYTDTKFKVNGTEYNISVYLQYQGTKTIYFFATHRPTLWYGAYKLKEAILYQDGVEQKHFVPFKSSTQGNGMLDIVGLRFHPKVGSGSFTISETPAS